MTIVVAAFTIGCVESEQGLSEKAEQPQQTEQEDVLEAAALEETPPSDQTQEDVLEESEEASVSEEVAEEATGSDSKSGEETSSD